MFGLEFLLGIAIVGFSVYQLLPAFMCIFDRRLADSSWNNFLRSQDNGKQVSVTALIPDNLRKRLIRRLQRAGYFSPASLSIYLLLNCVPIPLFYLVGRLAGAFGTFPVWAGLVAISLINSQVSRQIILRQKAFIKALFKIYRFLDLQMTAGIKVTDSLRGLPEAVHDTVVRPILIRFAALYELTLNLDLALEELRLAFGGTDCELLSTHLRQCLQTGEAGRSLARMEELLFSRYFNLMQIDTRRIRTHLLLTAILGISPGIILFLYPLFFEATQALQTVFG